MMNSVTPKVGAKHELLFNKPATDAGKNVSSFEIIVCCLWAPLLVLTQSKEIVF
jgi:hypothetical protein